MPTVQEKRASVWGCYRVQLRGAKKWTSLKTSYYWGADRPFSKAAAYAQAQERLFKERANRPGCELRIDEVVQS